MIAADPTRCLAVAGIWPGAARFLASLLGGSDRPLDAAPANRHADAEDVRGSRSGDPDAYRRLVERHQSSVGRIMWRFTRDRAEHEELAHQVFVEAYLGLSSYRAESPFAHWLARIATRVGYRHWRQRSRRRATGSLSEDAWARIAQASDGDGQAREAAELAHHLLAQLPPNDRLVLTLRYLEQHSVEQTAYLAGWSRARVRVQAHRAIRKLRKLAAKAGIELQP